jgi:hypothetical protein
MNGCRSTKIPSAKIRHKFKELTQGIRKKRRKLPLPEGLLKKKHKIE